MQVSEVYVPNPHAIQQEKGQSDFSITFLKELVSLINHDKNPYTSEVRNQMFHILSELETHGCHIREGNDDFRAPFVGLQGVIEHCFANQKTLGKIPHLLAAIHTPTPATPLCAKVDGKDIENLVAPSLLNDQDKLATVKERAISIRRLLANSGTVLYAIYPEGGLEKRTESEQKIFLEECNKYPEQLKISRLKKEVDPSFVGALYFFTDESGNRIAFSIKAQQANKPLEKSTWGIWFGSITHPEINKRVKEVSAYLIENGGVDLQEEFSKMADVQ